MRPEKPQVKLIIHMNLSSVKTVKELLNAHGIKPSKGLGQNFLVNPHAVQKLVSAADIQPSDTVLEIGPGMGALTQELAKQANKVIAIEKDVKMVEILKETLAEFPNVKIIHADALKLDCLKFDFKQYKIVANLPYYITAPLIRTFLEHSNANPYSMTLIVQKEVAQRICAKPPDMNILALSVQFYATPKVVSYVKKSAFWPQPKVDAAIIHIVPHRQEPPVDPKKFFKVMKAGFKQPRKQLKNNLPENLLSKAAIDPTRRAETLSLQDWLTLASK